MSQADRIRQLVSDRPGLKAQQIAEELGLLRAQVVTALNGEMSAEVTEDNAYRWWPRTRPMAASQTAPAPRTFLANLCRYYLDCLSHESGSGVSIVAANGAEYVALNALPFAAEPVLDRAAGKIVQRVRGERSQLTLYVGYALRLRTIQRGDEEEMRIEPILLYPVDEAPEGREETLRPASGIPLFNLEVLKSLLAADSGNIIDEAIHLSEELGLASTEDDLPQWDEIVLRLQRCRPDWGWREDLNPYALSEGVALHELAEPGIYNRALLFGGSRSPFTYGLEAELRKLAQLDDEATRDTALGLWLRDTDIEAALVEDRPILEVLPLNTEQRQSVVQGLSAPLTVVTGPPGTGKSQVVTSLLINVAWQGGSAMFASKNNHAVDVVESRVNELGPYPLLLRLGKEEHHARIAEHLAGALAESSNQDDEARYARLAQAREEDRSRFREIQDEIRAVVRLRNSVDELERGAEPARFLFGEMRFREMRLPNAAEVRRRLDALAATIDAARESAQPAVVRLVWDSLKARRFGHVADMARELAPDAERLGVAPPAPRPEDDNPTLWEDYHRALSERLQWAARVEAYKQALEELRSARALERLAADLTQIAEESAHDSGELWRSWLRLWPSRWDPRDRRLLAEYVSLLQMIAAGGGYDEGAGRKVFRRYFTVFPKVAKLLPCWAVTSLSARGRLPFEPGLFDVAVIDEASQCDIASALPLLYRARRSVIIGDPLQLKHVSTVAPQQDRLLLVAHGLAEGRAAWAYSVNSLFDLARSFSRHDDIVNLRDHHRSHRDIINFSNRHFYRGNLRIATDHDALKSPRSRGPAVRWLDVRGKVTRPSGGGALNLAEAVATVAELRKLVVAEEYGGSVGVVTPFRAQANRIRVLVHQDRELAQRLASLQFVADTVHGFQGDERDVIFFSPVVSAGVGESTLRFLKGHGNLFNVAVTRARSELRVVGDRQAALDCGVNYLAGFARYARELEPHEAGTATHEDLGPQYPVMARPELVSDWERLFYRALYRAGLHPIPQYEEAQYALDFALFDGERKLDVEVDGENYHRNWDGETCRRDQIRSQRLSDLGWEIMRFWVYEIRDDIEDSVRRVQAWMASRS